jgi:hypothetical protein
MTTIDPNNAVTVAVDEDVTVIATSEKIGPAGPPGPTGPQGPPGLPGAGSPASDPPLMDGTVAIGTSLMFAREDHVHPSDTSRIAKAGDTMTGPLLLAADPTTALGAATKQYADALRSNAVLLNTLTASNSAALLDTTSLLAAFNEFELRFQNIVPAVTQRILQFQVHSGGAIKTTGYQCAFGAFGNSTYYSYPYASGVSLTYPSVGSEGMLNSAPGFSGVLRISNPAAGGLALINGNGGYMSAAAGPSACLFTGVWNTAGVVDGFQISMYSGNITSGTVKVYGIR